MNKTVFILITLYSIANIYIYNFSANTYRLDAIRQCELSIASESDSHDESYLNQYCQMDFIFITENPMFLFFPLYSSFKDNLIHLKLTAFLELPYKPPLSI
jgi:hypothetical protein